MTDDPTPNDPALTELVELTAFLLDNVDRIPPHRRRQAVLALERVERLVPLPDADVDALEDVQLEHDVPVASGEDPR